MAVKIFPPFAAMSVVFFLSLSSQAFIIDSNAKIQIYHSTSKKGVTSLLVMHMNPREEQSREQVVDSADMKEQYLRVSNQVENKKIDTMESYQKQYKQYYEKLITSSQNTVEETSWSNDPYERQYQQYVNSQGPSSMKPSFQYETVESVEEQQNVEQFFQKPQEQVADWEDIEERNLHMVSNELQYKKLLGQNLYSLADIDFKALRQGFLDSMEDVLQKNIGKFKGQSHLNGKKLSKEERKTVVVLGTGWGAHAFVELAQTKKLRIVVVSPVNHFVFTPMLASAAVGTVEYRSMTEAIRVTNPLIDNYVEGRAIGVDVTNKKLSVQVSKFGTVTGAYKGVASNGPDRLEPEPLLTSSLIQYTEDGEMVQQDLSQGASRIIELNYDYLLCAVGTASRSNLVPGAKEHCFNLKTAQDSKRLRTAIGEALEFASRPDVQEFYYPNESDKVLAKECRRRRVRIAIVGGGATGVELSGELSDFFSQICGSPEGAFQHLKDDISIMLVHSGSDLVPAMDPELRQRALDSLQSQGVEVRLNTRLKEVGRDYIRIGEKGSDVIETIAVGVTVWAAGNEPVPFVNELLSQLPENAVGPGGRINVDQWLRCPTPTVDSFGSILVLGDVAYMESTSKYDPEPRALPQTAQVAGQQGEFSARILNRGYNLQQTPPKLPELTDKKFSLLRIWLIARGLEEAPEFTFLSLGLIAYIGQQEALNQVQIGDVPIFNYSGKIAFILWRSIYLAKQASSRNQELIAFDWLRTEQFGRDITRL